jgi:CrcB protein
VRKRCRSLPASPQWFPGKEESHGTGLAARSDPAESVEDEILYFKGESILDRYLVVMLGGAIGTLARYVVGTAIMSRVGGRFPWGTVVINITGSFLIGFIVTAFTERFSPHPNWRLLLVVGVLGGYTTFSAFEWETLGLVRDGLRWLGLLNAAGSVVLGYIAVWLGVVVARKG